MNKMPTIEEIKEDEVNIKDELEYFAKSIYKEFKDKFIKIYIESRQTSGLGSLLIDLDKSTTLDLDISYYKIEDMTKEMIQVIGDNKNYKNTAYFIFNSRGEYFVIEDQLKV